MRARHACIGIDLGGSKVLFDLLDERFRVVQSELMETLPERGERRFTKRFAKCLRSLVKTAQRRGLTVRCVGVGCAGFADSDNGVLTSSPNIPFIRDYPLAAKVARWAGAPTVIGNDVQMGLFGEHALGAARGCRSAFAIFIGTGVGGALIVDGRLYRGASGLAGEIGHFLIDAHGPLSGSERHGLLDDVASRSAIAAQAASFAAKHWAPHLYKTTGADLMNIKSAALARSVRHGDHKIEELIRSRSRIIGVVMANLVNFLSPDCIVMGGGLVDDLGDIVVPEAAAAMRRYALPSISRHVNVVASALKGHAVAVGAAIWARERLTQRPVTEGSSPSPEPSPRRRAVRAPSRKRRGPPLRARARRAEPPRRRAWPAGTRGPTATKARPSRGARTAARARPTPPAPSAP
jgi:glucokinase